VKFIVQILLSLIFFIACAKEEKNESRPTVQAEPECRSVLVCKQWCDDTYNCGQIASQCAKSGTNCSLYIAQCEANHAFCLNSPTSSVISKTTSPKPNRVPASK